MESRGFPKHSVGRRSRISTMKHIRIISAEGHEVAGFRAITHTLIPHGSSLKKAQAAASILGVRVQRVEGPLFSGSIDGDEMISFINCTLPEVADFLGESVEKIHSAVAALPADKRAEWEKMFRGESDEQLESENDGLGFSSIHISGSK